MPGSEQRLSAGDLLPQPTLDLVSSLTGARTSGKRSGVTAVLVSASYWSVDLRYDDIAELAQLHRLRDSCSGPGVGYPNVPRP
jgi:hypothetical protein